MKGRTVKLKVWEDDISNQLVFEHNYILAGDESFINLPLTQAMQDKGDDWKEGSEQELFLEVEYAGQSIESEVIDVDEKAPPKKIETGRSEAVVKKPPKEKFEKVIGLGEEAVIYVTNEIATEIKVDKDGKVVSYPDYGVYNGMSEYKEDNKIYCKTATRKNKKGKIVTVSIFPTYKAYIYRGKKIGEAIKKLKQDIANNTRENAESTVLEVARHSGDQNKNTLTQGGPTPSSSISKMFRIRYKTASNHSGKTSYRYRIVDDIASNFTVVKNVKQEVSSGGMSIGSRSSISIDPWISQALIGCLGIRGQGGGNHSSCAQEMNDQSASNYKNIYHSLNNYLETIIPELTGVYGRRGYSSSGKVNVAISKYDKETRVYVLIDPLPELNKDEKLFDLEDARRALKLIYDNYGKEIARNVEMMYRWECTHFKSDQYKHCGGPGMEAANNTHPTYGWNGEMYIKFPQYTPVGLWDAYENKGMSGKGGNTQVTDRKKRYVQFPSVEAGMVYVAEFLVRHNGNIGRWHTTDTDRQPDYVKNINTTVPRIVNSFK